MAEELKPRIEYTKFAHEALKALLDIEKYISNSGLDHKLLHLI